ncbi:MAG: 1,4-dihydroxy-6-naphthoate synthase [Leptospiraceae bacterium]|nr:1,4-dihydroxy-6-naphthoate synthase [Leptospiraceae bacterium]MCB1168887.1 1,4-dihydroxy-6-naphthoate synthase [Leptospiraceae bacterium]
MKLAISPCPNDTYIFHWMIHNPDQPEFEPVFLDIQELNQAAENGSYELTKLSCYAYLGLQDKYTMLPAGGALGRGCGPLLVRSAKSPDLSGAEFLDYLKKNNRRILIPGHKTTAALMLRMYMDSAGIEVPTEFMRYDRILPALQQEQYEAGIIIHEERFTFPSFGAFMVQDLGQWWEESTGSPIPLGLIAIRNDLADQAGQINEIVRSSLEYANAHPEAGMDFIRSHAQAMDDTAIRDHIGLYVNDYSLDMGSEGRKAMQELESRARKAGAL